MIQKGGIKGDGGGREDHEMMGDGMQCINHHHRNNNPGGICAFCLQEKLGKLVSSSFPLPIPPSFSSNSHSSSSSSSYSSSSPSFRSHIAPSSVSDNSSSSSSLPLSLRPTSVKKHNTDTLYHENYMLRNRLPFLLAKKQSNKKKTSAKLSSSVSANVSTSADSTFKRSKSTATQRRVQFLENVADEDDDDDIVIEGNFSPRKRNGFWSFFYLPSKSSVFSKKLDANKSLRDSNNGSPRISTVNNTNPVRPKEKFLGSSLGRRNDINVVVVEEADDDKINSTQNTCSVSSFERKVSRSRSVGCGSRSFSGDFFERFSTGFGDSILRRVESQREGKNKIDGGGATLSRGGDHHHHHQCMKERVRCGGIFGGLMLMTSSSYNSSSSSSYWVPSSADEMNGESLGVGRSRSWGWAFASPMRVFSTKASSKDKKRDGSSDKSATPNLSAIPSLLAVRG